MRRPCCPWDILINATPVGSGTRSRRLRCRWICIARAAVVLDMIYDPWRSAIPCARRKAAGGKTIDGLQMLLAQAVAQFETWTGLEAPVDVMKSAALFLAQEEVVTASPLLPAGALRGHRPRRAGAAAHGARRWSWDAAPSAPWLAEMMVRAGVALRDRDRPRLRRGVEPAAAVPLRRGGRRAGLPKAAAAETHLRALELGRRGARGR